MLALRRYDAAIANYDRAIALQPDFAEPHKGRGDALQRQCRYEEAVSSYDRAIALNPGLGGLWNNRGVALQNLRQLEAAEESFRRAVDLEPSEAGPRVNQALLYLLQEDFSRGWPALAWVQETPEGRDGRPHTQPVWTGKEDISGKTLFAYLRKGLGDAIQFYRYAVLAQERGAHVVVSLNDPLLPLLRNAVRPVPVVGLGEAPPQFDYHISLMNLPRALGAGAVSMDRYLAAEPARVKAWRERIGDHGYRIGVAWQGDAAALGAEGKSFPLAALQAIAHLPGVRLISLQKNAGAEQLKTLPAGMKVEAFDDLDSGPGAFLEFGSRHGESGSGDFLRHGHRPSGRGPGRAQLDCPEIRPGMALVFGPDGHALVSARASFPSAESGRMGACFRGHGNGIAPDPRRARPMN